MRSDVELADVIDQIERYGPLATLMTVSPDGTPHVGTVVVSAEPPHLAMAVGPHTRDNVLANPSVCLTWLREGHDYQLILDGLATVAGDPDDDGLHPMAVTVERGILHRVAGRDDAGPSCLSLRAAS